MPEIGRPAVCHARELRDAFHDLFEEFVPLRHGRPRGHSSRPGCRRRAATVPFRHG
jgi:hypothetical protein